MFAYSDYSYKELKKQLQARRSDPILHLVPGGGEETVWPMRSNLGRDSLFVPAKAGTLQFRIRAPSISKCVREREYFVISVCQEGGDKAIHEIRRECHVIRKRH